MKALIMIILFALAFYFGAIEEPRIDYSKVYELLKTEIERKC